MFRTANGTSFRVRVTYPYVNTAPMSYECADVYLNLRQQILSLHQIQPGLRDEQGMVAYVMETGYDGAVATLVAVADGTASLYFSNGGGMIGAGQAEEVNQVSRRVVAFAGQFVPLLQATTEHPLPSLGQVRFYLVTANGTMTAPMVAEAELGAGNHALSQLFFAGQQLMSAIREHSEKNA